MKTKKISLDNFESEVLTDEQLSQIIGGNNSADTAPVVGSGAPKYSTNMITVTEVEVQMEG